MMRYAVGLVAWITWLCCFGAIGSAQSEVATAENNGLHLTDVTSQCGIDFVHTTGASGRRYIVETVVAGLALFDYDDDGWLDIYFLNGQPLPGTTPVGEPPRNALYRNNGDWTFTDVTVAAGVAAHAYGMGVVAGDFDEDGDDDLYLANFGKNILYRNEGDGTFTDVTDSAGIGNSQGFGTGAVWFDIDCDGDLDLYSGRYVEFDFNLHQTRTIKGYEFHPGPAAYPPALHQLFRNNGDGGFTDISLATGIASVPGTGMGAIAFDSDQDGDIDLFVCNDGKPNFLFVNDGRGNFTEDAFLAGVAVDRAGVANGNMGVDVADIDGDGLLDVLTTDYQDEMPVLYRNVGQGQFEDFTSRAKISAGLLPHVKWGIGLIDIDNDTDRDAFVACGHFLDNIRFIDDRTNLQVPNFLMLNDGKGKFSNPPGDVGTGMKVVASSRGAAFDDLDNDGDVDIVILNSDGRPTLIRNDLASDARSLAVELVGRRSTRSAAGATVRLTAGGHTQLLTIHLGRGYQSHYGTRLMFGLGENRSARNSASASLDIEALSITWPTGHVQSIDPGELQLGKVTTLLEPL